MRLKRALCGVGAVWLMSGCAVGTDSGEAANAASCQPGTTVPCLCVDGTLSSRACDPSGTTIPACACGAAEGVPGTAGTGAAGSAAPMIGTGTAAGAGGGGAGESPGDDLPDFGDNWGRAGTSGFVTPGTSGAGGAQAPVGGPTPEQDAVPPGEHCSGVAAWDPVWSQFEQEVLLLTNQARAQGATCGDRGSFPPVGPLAMNASLRCSARLHSQDMGEAGYFAHDSPNGDSPFDRMGAAGYEGRLTGENIAKGQQSPADVVRGWMESPGHCANIMNGGFQHIGVGYWQGQADNPWFNGNKLWTQNFGSPRSGSGGAGCTWGTPFCQP